MKVLLIEDDVKITAVVERGLRSEGISVECSHDGLDGLWRATESHFDVIVLDIMLPGLNGFQVCQRLRAQGNWTPLLFLTAKQGDLDEAEGLDTGADDYLSKPFSFGVLVARLHALKRMIGAVGVELRRLLPELVGKLVPAQPPLTFAATIVERLIITAPLIAAEQ